MKKVRIRAMKRAVHDDLIRLYENPIEHTCDINVGDEFISEEAQCPAGFCRSAWDSLRPFVEELANGGGNFYDGWMKNPYAAMLSCNDGFRPVSFLIETVEEESTANDRDL